MSAARTARRRRKQAKQGFTHMDPMKRPLYKAPADATTSARREAAFRERARKMAGRKKK